MDDFAQLEQFMSDTVMREAQDEVQDFIAAIQQDGVTQAEVDEVRQQTLMALQDPTTYPSFIQYLVASGLLERGDAPAEYDVGFVLSILGLVGVAQQLVTAG